MRRIASRLPGACGFGVAARHCSAAAAAVPKGSVAMSTPDQDKKLDELASVYAQLTLKELTELQRRVFKKLGHSDDFYEQALLRGLGGGGGGGGTFVAAAPAQAAAPQEDIPPPPEEVKIEKTNFNVHLEKYPAENKVKLIKELRTVTNLPLKEAKDAIEKAPGVIQEHLGKDDAEKLKKLLETHGATVSLI
jgi:large subunit ribosomal protein L7/L12